MLKLNEDVRMAAQIRDLHLQSAELSDQQQQRLSDDAHGRRHWKSKHLHSFDLSEKCQDVAPRMAAPPRLLAEPWLRVERGV